MDKEKYRAVIESLSRIELMIKVIMEEKYGKKETNRVYKEIVSIVSKEFDNLFINTLDECLPEEEVEHLDESN